MGFIRSSGCLLATIVLIVVLVIGAAVGLATYGYSQLDTNFEAIEYSPELDIGISSIASAIFDVFKGDLLGAAANIIKGVNINGTLTVSNRSFIPLYLPAMNHKVSIEGKETERVIQTEATWIGPNGKEDFPFNIMVASRDLPQVVLNALAKGGTVDVTIVSEIPLGAFSITRTSHRQEAISKSLSSYTEEGPSSSQPPVTPTSPPTLQAPSVTFDGWYVGSSRTNVVTKTEEVAAKVTLAGGSDGVYKLRVRRDIRLADDTTVVKISFDYDGIATNKELSFIPPFATDEANTDGYHVDLLRDSHIVWTLTDAYPPRLRITVPTQGPLVVNFDGWYVDGSRVSTATTEKQVIARVTLLGGNSGQYRVRIRRDIISASDETVKEDLFTYNGISATKELTFVPPYATNEAATDGYHIDVIKDGNIVWTLTDAYPPRLRVAKPVTTYSLNVSVSPAGTGIVSLNPSGGTYESGTTVTLTATASPGFQFASWSGDASETNSVITITMNSNKAIMANFTTGPLSISFSGWYVGGSKVDTTTKGSTVLARIVISGGGSGQYKMRIRRDIVWADDQTVKNLIFNHNGTQLTVELSFSPPYATGEASTDGYHIDLVKDGYIVWTLTDAYPPRLRVKQ